MRDRDSYGSNTRKETLPARDSDTDRRDRETDNEGRKLIVKAETRT
jgi:hypothetical protein